ncbi:hypothetical protein KSP40_PGU012716 [Platanthera guangdongensis]|uniref:PMI1/PMIR1-2 C-terminal domain-containing protein n=1 Tax=Platanthera guangdongensis TaxID=2320717 RepID=A0ABR2M232_9ASPA
MWMSVEESEFPMIEHEKVNSKQDFMNDYAKRKLDSESVIMKGSSQNEVIDAVMNEEQADGTYYAEEASEVAILLGQLEEMGYPETNVDDSEKLHVDNVDPNDEEGSMKTPPHSLDEFTEEVASEFLSMLDLEHYSSDSSHESGPESPRKQLWKQFKTESLVFSDCLFGLDVDVDKEMNWGNSRSGVFDFSSIACDTDSHNGCSYEAVESKSKAQVLEDAEMEALLREWGLDEKVFDGSPPGSMTGFGSPIHLPPEEPPLLPPLCEKLGPFVQTKDGGFLRSMSPNLFKNSKSNGNLIMQVSKPVVMPAEMGSDNTEILQHLASIGVEKLSMQANKLMPLEEITGCLMQKLASDSLPDVEEHQRQDSILHLKHEDDCIFDLNTTERKENHFSMTPVRSGELTDEYVSLEDLAPLAMDKIEALSIEGLKIQSGMSDEEAPSNITKKFVGEVPGFIGKEVGDLTSLGLEGAVGLHLLNVEDNGDDVDGLMGLSISLDEWMQLDMGIVKEECELSDRTSKILAAHHAKSTEFSGRGWREDRRGKNASRKRGLLENYFTVALMVQLRDPFRNYEPVGTPMLALIQVERVFLPPKPKIYSTVLEKCKIEPDIESDTDLESVLKLEKEDFVDVIPRFKVADVHVAGLKAESGKRRHWGSPIQQQSGSRWLLANGMGKLNKKHPFLKSNTCNKVSQLSSKVQPEETLWSISSRVHGSGHKWNESSKMYACNNFSFTLICIAMS